MGIEEAESSRPLLSPGWTRARRGLALAGFIVCLLALAALWGWLTWDGLHGIFGAQDPGGGSTNTGGGSGDPTTPRQRVSVDFVFLLMTAITVLAGSAWNPALLRWMQIRPAAHAETSPTGPRPAQSASAAAGWFAAGLVLYLAIVVIAFRINSQFNDVTGTHTVVIASRAVPGLGKQYAADIIDAVTAGFWEELLLFALPIALLTKGRPRSREVQIGVWAVIFVIRLGIHLYYGWGAVFVLPWMIGAYLLFKYLGSIWPMVAAHAVYDALASLSGRAPQTYDAVHNIFEAAVIAAGMTLAYLLQRQRTLSTPQPPHH